MNNRRVISLRGPKDEADPLVPYGFFNERERVVGSDHGERAGGGEIAEVSTILLTNRECPFRCVMCDLWKNTTDIPVPPGAIPAQIGYALSRLPAARHLKLYNSGSFFDTGAIPPEDYPAIASLVRGFERLVVESHPHFIGDPTWRFADLLEPRLEVAIGLETVHPGVLRGLNKKMDPEDFRQAVKSLTFRGISTRAFILLRPPYLNEKEGVKWARRSIDFAFDCGVSACTVIPVRGGNGAMEELAALGHFTPPSIPSLEEVVAYGISMGRGAVYADLWDLELFSSCDDCFDLRRSRLAGMNLFQQIPPPVSCSCGDGVPDPAQ